MLKVGITGGIGSGKTTVCKIFELLSIPVFYADREAKRLMQEDPELIDGLKKTFGSSTYLADGTINRSHLADLVFNDELQLNKLNQLVHPAVFAAFDTWLKKQSAPYVVKEAALLFESGSYRLCDFNVLVRAPEHLKLSRVMLRDQISKEAVLARMARQMSDDEKSKMADLVLVNDENELLIPQIIKLHEQLLAGDLNR